MMKVNNMSTALALDMDMLNFNILVSIIDLFVVYLDNVERRQHRQRSLFAKTGRSQR